MNHNCSFSLDSVSGTVLWSPLAGQAGGPSRGQRTSWQSGYLMSGYSFPKIQMEPRKEQPRGMLKGQNESNLICWKLGCTSRILAGRQRANYCSHPSRSSRSVGPQSRTGQGDHSGINSTEFGTTCVLEHRRLTQYRNHTQYSCQ